MNSERTKRKLPRFAKKLLLLLMGIGFGIVAAELLLALTGMSLSPYESDPVLGTKLKADYRGWHTKEGRAFITTNSAGFRDREHTLAKPAGTIRIAVLGDSYCEALQVEMDETFCSVLEGELTECDSLDGRKAEVLNFGVSGYGTAQELLMLEHRVWDYEPDVVLLCFLSGNDVRNNSKTLEPNKDRPFFRLDGGQLVIDESFRQRPLFASRWVQFKDRLISSSRLLTLLYRIKHRDDSQESVNEGQGREVGLDTFVYSEPTKEEHREAWLITERLIERMHREVKAKHAAFVIATLTNGVQVDPDPAVREDLASRLGVEDLNFAGQRIAALAERMHCPAIVLAEKMAAHAEQHGVHLHGFENTKLGTGHWNADGHRVAGELVAAELCTLLPGLLTKDDGELTTKPHQDKMPPER